MTFDELRQVQLDILQSIHDYCQQNNIRYSLAYGTLLGAVRHKGYIPWDDDIDIAMLREDYEKFLEHFNGTFDKYRVYECRKDKDYKIAFAKVCDLRTLVIERANTKKIGVFVDVFPIDDLCDSYEDSLKVFNRYNKIRLMVQIKGRLIGDVKKLWKKGIMAVLKAICYFCDVNVDICKMNKSLSEFHNKRSAYVGLVVDGSKKEIVERDIWSSFSYIMFENKLFMTVENTDKYLKHCYGDYMMLPPKEQQVPKHDFDVIYWIE